MRNVFLILLMLGTVTISTPLTSHADKQSDLLSDSTVAVRHIDRVFPTPYLYTVMTGEFSISKQYVVAVTANNPKRLKRALIRFNKHLQELTGVPLQWQEYDRSTTQNNHKADLTITIHGESEIYPSLDTDERYTLSIDQHRISIDANSLYGAIHGLQSLLQLAAVDGESVHWPALVIEDKPRFRWRGLLQDVVRHWMPVDVIKRQLDAMAAVKMNVFHWHLTDDQAFRVESKSFPRLHQLGSDGYYYTQEQIKEVVEYAADRGIRVVPEFDLPGHSRSWQIAYPQLSSVPGKRYHLIKQDKHFSDPIDPTKEENYQLLAGIIWEMSALFPDQFFHIGGDEVDDNAWKKNASIREFMRQNAISDTKALQAYFVQRYQKIVTKLGKTAIGWDDILHSQLPSDTVLHVWSSWSLHKDAAKYPIVVSRGYYLDSMQPAYYHHQRDPLDLVVKDISADLRADVERRILGGQVCSWAETINQHTVDMRNWPRTAAAAERFWSSRKNVDGADANYFYARLNIVSKQLQAIGLQHLHYPTEAITRLAENGNANALATLADVIEPTRYYNLYHWKKLLAYFTRSSWFYQSPDRLYPVERFLENIPPESHTARRFNYQVEQYLRGQLTSKQIEKLTTQLILWKNNHQRLQATIVSSDILRSDDLDQVSLALSNLAAAGLDALLTLESKATFSNSAWRAHQNTVDKLAFEYFTGNEMDFLIGRVFKPRPFRLHNVPIQQGVARLLEAARQVSD